MERFEKIAPIGNEIEALCLRGKLEERGIPHLMQSYYDSAYNGLFQFSTGWGHVEAPVEHRDEILGIIEAIRQQSSQQNHEMDEGHRESRTNEVRLSLADHPWWIVEVVGVVVCLTTWLITRNALALLYAVLAVLLLDLVFRLSRYGSRRP